MTAPAPAALYVVRAHEDQGCTPIEVLGLDQDAVWAASADGLDSPATTTERPVVNDDRDGLVRRGEERPVCESCAAVSRAYHVEEAIAADDGIPL